MDDEQGDAPPFWLQSSTTTYNPMRRRSSNFFLNSGILIIVLPITALILICVIIPSFLSFTSQFMKPNLVKKSWDSLNLVLVFFAIICGFLSRKTDDGGSGEETSGAGGNSFSNLPPQPAEERSFLPPHHHQQEPMDRPWIDYPNNRLIYNPMDSYNSSLNVMGNTRLRRSSSSYPDLRQESLWIPASDERRRFYDDINVDGYRYGSWNSDSNSNYLHRRRPHTPSEPEVDYSSNIKIIPVDTFVVHQRDVSPPETEPPPPTEPPQPKPPPPPPPPAPAEGRRKERRSFEAIQRKEKVVNSEVEVRKFQIPPPSPPPPPPPPPRPPLSSRISRSDRSDSKYSKSERKKNSTAKDIKNTLASFYNQTKKKKQQRSKETFDDIFQYYDSSVQPVHFGPPPSPPPPPPPPPPPTSVFHHLFKKTIKNKKIHSVSSATNQKVSPPKPPPPPPATSSRSSKRKIRVNSPPKTEPIPASKQEFSRQRKPMGKPPLPTRINNYYPSDEILNSGGQSPLIPMPPPPPPPPFRIPEMKFVRSGDYVKIESTQNSRSTSPDLEDNEAPSNQESPVSTPKMGVEDSSSSTPRAFCPSPDVNNKADNFIARFRAGLKLEKMNSI